ncbi:hypothetical protein AAY473_016559 [Plecturocebus cupreus]
MASPASGVSPGHIGILDNRYTARGQSCLCTAVHREPRHRRRNLKKKSESSQQPSEEEGNLALAWEGLSGLRSAQGHVLTDKLSLDTERVWLCSTTYEGEQTESRSTARLECSDAIPAHCNFRFSGFKQFSCLSLPSVIRFFRYAKARMQDTESPLSL